MTIEVSDLGEMGIIGVLGLSITGKIGLIMTTYEL